jgi:hypothetical protein
MKVFEQIPRKHHHVFRALIDARIRIETDTRRAWLTAIVGGDTFGWTASGQNHVLQRQINREAVFAQDFGFDRDLLSDRAILRSRAFQILDSLHDLAFWVDALEPIAELPTWLMHEGRPMGNHAFTVDQLVLQLAAGDMAHVHHSIAPKSFADVGEGINRHDYHAS